MGLCGLVHRPGLGLIAGDFVGFDYDYDDAVNLLTNPLWEWEIVQGGEVKLTSVSIKPANSPSETQIYLHKIAT